MENLKNKLSNLSTRQAIIYFSILSLVLTLFIGKISSQATEGKQKSSEPFDTYIPYGFVLVPIEVQNYEALDSVLGNYGVVDLYKSTGGDGRPGQKVARAVKILRAPLNPNHFAILVEENLAPEIAKSFDPFFVVIQNPKTNGTQIETNTKKHTQAHANSIYYGDRQ